MGTERKLKYFPDPDQIQASSARTINDLRGDLGSLRLVVGLEDHLLSENLARPGATDTCHMPPEMGRSNRPPGQRKPGGPLRERQGGGSGDLSQQSAVAEARD